MSLTKTIQLNWEVVPSSRPAFTHLPKSNLTQLNLTFTKKPNLTNGTALKC